MAGYDSSSGGVGAGTGSHSGGGGSNGNYGTSSGFSPEGGHDLQSSSTITGIADGLQGFINTTVAHGEADTNNDTVGSSSAGDVAQIISDDGDTYTVEFVESGLQVSGVYDASGGAFPRNTGDYTNIFSMCGNTYMGWVLQECVDEDDLDWDRESEDTEDDDENYVEDWEDNDFQSTEEPQNPGTVTAIA